MLVHGLKNDKLFSNIIICTKCEESKKTLNKVDYERKVKLFIVTLRILVFKNLRKKRKSSLCSTRSFYNMKTALAFNSGIAFRYTSFTSARIIFHIQQSNNGKNE